MASFLMRLFDRSSAGEPAGFVDVPAGGEHAENMDALADSGVTRCCSESPLRFCPEQATTRAQMASFIDRALEARETGAGRLFVDVAAGNANSCGLRGKGELLCWGIDRFDINEVPAEYYSDVSVGHEEACAVRRGGELVCWGTTVQDRPEWWTPPTGASTQVDVNPELACALRTDGTAACWGIPSGVGADEPPAGRFTAVSAGTLHACGLRPSGEIECWGNPGFGITDAPSGRFVSVSAGVSI